MIVSSISRGVSPFCNLYHTIKKLGKVSEKSQSSHLGMTSIVVFGFQSIAITYLEMGYDSESRLAQLYRSSASFRRRASRSGDLANLSRTEY